MARRALPAFLHDIAGALGDGSLLSKPALLRPPIMARARILRAKAEAKRFGAFY